jgi:serine/threonine-protein kinase
MRDRSQKIEELFRAALVLEPDRRAAFLSQACGSDSELRAEIELLFKSHNKSNSQTDSGHASESQAEIAPILLSHYRIRNRLGTGGMGEVYLADDLRLERRVAIKLIAQNKQLDENLRMRLLREARAAAKLNHPNICSIYEFGTEQGHSFIAMQYVEGESLADRIKLKPPNLRQSIDIAIQITDALAEAHAQGIVHRDIKPQNVMVTPKGQVKILDFGVAKVTPDFQGEEATTQILLTQSGTVVGTVPYMSPEQIRAEPIDLRSDIFSFGVTLYELLAGRHPFAGASPEAVASNILTQEPPPLARFATKIPAELERIVRKCLEKDKVKRYQSAREVAIDLRKLPRKLFYSSSSSTQPISDYVNGREFRLRVRTVLVLSIVVLVLAALAAYLIFWPPEKRTVTINSIAVLPFNTVASDEDTEYISDGITDDLIDSLSQIPGLKVMSRNTVFRYRNQDIDASEVARLLRVKAILAGRFIKHGERLSISAELVDARDGSHIWGQQYNRRYSDIMAVQEEIAREITSNLRFKLTGELEKRFVGRKTSNTEAYQNYLKGKYYTDKLTEDGLRKGIDYFNRAISLDPSYADAHNAIANSYILMSDWLLAPKEAITKAKEEVAEALALDGDSADVRATLGIISHIYDWDWPRAEDEFKRAIQLNQNSFNAHEAYYTYLISVGRFEEALAEARLTLEIDPLSIGSHTGLAGVYYYFGHYDEAIDELKRTLEMNQDFWVARALLGLCYERIGKREEAISELQRATQLEDKITGPLAALGQAYAVTGRKVEALRVIDELRERAQRSYVPPYYSAIVYMGLGDINRGFEWLERSYEDRNYQLTRLMVNPQLEGVRSDPRFLSLARRIGLAK